MSSDNTNGQASVSPVLVPVPVPVTVAVVDRQVVSPNDISPTTMEESERQRIDRLGRERPPQFKSFWAEVFFVYSVIASQFMAVRA